MAVILSMHVSPRLSVCNRSVIKIVQWGRTLFFRWCSLCLWNSLKTSGNQCSHWPRALYSNSVLLNVVNSQWLYILHLKIWMPISSLFLCLHKPVIETVSKPERYVGWWCNALRVPSFQEFDHVSSKSTRSMLWHAQSHSWTKLGMGTLNALYVIILHVLWGSAQHSTYLLGVCTTLLMCPGGGLWVPKLPRFSSKWSKTSLFLDRFSFPPYSQISQLVHGYAIARSICT